MMDIDTLLTLDAGTELDAAIMQMVWGYADEPTLYSLDVGVAASLPLSEGAQMEVCVLWDGTCAARVALPVSSKLALASPDYQTGKGEALVRCRAWLAAVKAGVVEARDG